MSGQLSDNLNIEAVITDQNVPFQPEGNTQQIRDFDNVLIRLHTERYSISAGDLVSTNPFAETYFLKYYKNIQGVEFTYNGGFKDWKSKNYFINFSGQGKICFNGHRIYRRFAGTVST